VSRPSDRPCGAMPDTASHPGEILGRWAWVEPAVWTFRMLTALERGVKGGTWFSLMDKVYAPDNLRAAFARVKANRGSAGVDHVTVGRFEARLDEELDRLYGALRDGTYRPQAIRRAWIPKPGSRERRPLGIPTVRDRVVQTALRNVLEPVFEREFAEHSYGFRPHRGAKDALRRVDGLLRAGYTWVVDADLRSYLESASYCTPVHARPSKRVGWLSITLMRKPLRRPQRTWTAWSSPRFTRCNTVCRVTPRRRVASSMGT
jgi:RNA-directed DNA polymerase